MIPTLDLSHFTRGDKLQRQQFADGLLAGLIDTGFAKVINHGLDRKKLDEMFRWVSVPHKVTVCYSDSDFGTPLERDIFPPAGRNKE